MIETRYHGSVNVLQEMFDCSAAAPKAQAPFDRAQWYALLADTGLTPLIVTAHDGVRQAALALTETNGLISPLRNWYNFTWRPLVPASPDGDTLLEAMARQLLERGHRVTLTPVPDEDGSATRLAEAFAKAGWRVKVTESDTYHILNVAGRPFAEYWAKRPGALRTTLKRKASKVTTHILDHFDAEVWARYEAVYAESWKPREGEPMMLRAFAEAEGQSGRLRLGLATHEGEAVAAQFWTVENGVAYIHKLAHLESHRFGGNNSIRGALRTRY